jgi:hypothetical protein
LWLQQTEYISGYLWYRYPLRVNQVNGSWPYTIRSDDQWLIYSVLVSRNPGLWSRYGSWTLKFGQIFSCHHLFSAMLGDIDLIFGIWVYNDELQIKFTFRSGPMIFGWVMALGLWNLAKYLVVTTFVRYALRYWLDIWYVGV